MKQKIYSLDVETTRFSPESDTIDFILATMVNFDNIEDNEVFMNEKEFHDKIISLCNDKLCRYKIYCHNLDFDAKFIFPILSNLPEGFSIDLVKSPRLLEIKIQKDEWNSKTGLYRKRTIISIRDSFSLLFASVEKLGESLHFEKEILQYNDIDALIHYCIKDNQIVIKAINKLVETLNLLCEKHEKLKEMKFKISNLPLTLSSIVKKILIRLEPNLWSNSRQLKKNEIYLRFFYFGGRTEVFNFNNLKECIELDFNSLYPSILSDNVFPYANFNLIDFKCEGNKLNNILSKKNIIAVICLVEDNDYLPYFPARIEEKLIFSKGIKRAMIFPEELTTLKNVNFKPISIEKIIIGQQTNALNQIYKHMYQMRLKFKENHPALQFFVKRLMNMGYGKFGENREKQNNSFIPFSRKEVLERLNEGKVVCLLDREYIIENNDSYSSYLKNNILIAIKITNLARMRLYDAFINVGKESVYYCDTDSLFLDLNHFNKIKKKINLSNQLGALKVEFIAKNFQGYSPKEYTYELDDKTIWKIKGVNTKKTPFNILDYYGEKGVLVSRPAKIGEINRRHLSFNSVINEFKKKSHYYDKRLILPDLTTLPFTINSDIQAIENINKKFIQKILTKKEVKDNE